MKKYRLAKFDLEAPYTGRRLESIPHGLEDCDPEHLGEFDTLEAGLAALAKHKSTARKFDTNHRPVWVIELVLLSELVLIDGGDPDDQYDWEFTGNEWDAEKDISQPYASPDLDRSPALAELAERYGTLEYDGHIYHIIDRGDGWAAAIRADDPIDRKDGTQPIYDLDLDGCTVVDCSTSTFVTWADDGTFSE